MQTSARQISALLQRRKNNEDLVIFPIIAKSCPWQSVGWLADMLQVRPKGGQPIWSKDTDVDGELTKIADEVTEIVKNRWFSKKPKNS